MRLLFCCLWGLACGPVPGESLGAGKTLTEFPGASEGMWTAARLLATVWKPGPRPGSLDGEGKLPRQNARGTCGGGVRGIY